MSTLMCRLLKLRSFRKDVKKFEEICTKIYYFHLNRDEDELIFKSLEDQNANGLLKNQDQSNRNHYNYINNKQNSIQNSIQNI